MNFKVVPLWKSHFSLGRSILTLEEPTIGTLNYKEYPISIFNLLKSEDLDTLVLVDDTISGFLQASENCKKNNIKLIYGIRLTICHDINDKSDEGLNNNAKYIIFLKNSNGYSNLMKIWSLASTEGFYYAPRIDWNNLKKLWSENLKLSVPFYDSFIFNNSIKNKSHIPDFSFTKPTFFIENHDLLFDDLIKEKTIKYCDSNNYNYLPSHSIYYQSEKDFLAYSVFRCISSRTNMSKPNLDNFSSDSFCFSKWLKLNS